LLYRVVHEGELTQLEEYKNIDTDFVLEKAVGPKSLSHFSEFISSSIIKPMTSSSNT